MFRFLISWGLYAIGDFLISLDPIIGRICESFTAYPLYNWFMCKSDDIQGNGKGPWQDPYAEDDRRSALGGTVPL